VKSESTQIAGRLARPALADRVSFYDHELSLEVRKHAQALIDELFVSQRFAFAVEQNGITFNLSQCEPRFV
jgi:hypothetical protein